MNTDVTSLLQLTKGLGRVLLGLYGAGTLLVAALNLDGLEAPILGVVSLALMWAALIILTLPSTEPFDLPKSIAVLALTAAMAAISTGNVSDPSAAGYSNWHLGAITFLLLVLALRGRRALAWIGFAILSLLTIGITALAGEPIASSINDLARQAGTLAIGTLFALVLRRASRTIAAIHDAQVVRSSRAASSYAAIQERSAQTIRLERDARPALDRILSGAPLSPEELRHFALLETTLRDGIRATGFSSERVAEATRQARERGLRVVLLDDRGSELVDGERSRVETALLEQLHATRGEGSITARLSPLDRDELATIVVEEDGEYRRVVVTSSGTEVTHLS